MTKWESNPQSGWGLS